MSSRKETLAQLKAARAGGGRSNQWKGEKDDADLYDTVDEDEYKDLVKDRLQRDDFIEDDDGSGYVDDGREETWGAQRDEDDDEEDEEDPEERRKRRAAKRAAKAKAKPSKPIPRPPPPPSANAYRPVISETKEDDFMSSLLSGMEEERPSRPIIPSSSPPQTSFGGRKRKSSPDYFQASSDGIELGSDESYLGRGSEWGLRAGPSSTFAGGASGSRLGADKRAKVSDKGKGPATKVKVEEDTVKVEDLDGDVGMDMQGSPDWPEDFELPGGMEEEEDDDVKPTIDAPMFEMDDDDDEDDLVVKPSHKPSGSSAAMGPPAKRKFVNATSVSLKNLRPPPAEPSTMKPLPKHADPDEDVPATPAWESLQDSLLLASDNVAGSDDLPPSSPPPPSRAKAAAVKGAPATTEIDAYESDGTTLRMYWLDYFEQEIKTEDSTTKNLYLFGKVFDRRGAKGKWVSCCLKIDGMERNLFVCPRPKTVIRGEVTDLEPSQSDVQSEFGRVRRENGVSSFMSKWVKRNYVFGVEGIPTGESDWLKVIYGFDEPALPVETSGNTFSHILGTNTSAFEILVLKRKIMGPCWLEIKDAVVSGKGVSWCKLEVTVDDPKKIRPLSESDGVQGTPPLTIMSIAARTIVNHKANDREVVCVSARVWENSNIDDPTPLEKQVCAINTIVRPLGEFPPGFVQKCQTEKSKIATVKTESMLLNNLVANIQRYDPDVLVGHDFLNGSLEAILERMGKLKTDHWSRFGRFKRKGRPPASNKFGGITALMSGRLACDLSGDGSKSMIPSTTWSLTEMCKTQLKIDRQDIDPEDTHTYFDNTVASPLSLLRFVRHCEVDTFFQMAIASKVQILPLTKQLTTLAGNAWNRTLNGGRAERNEYILLHEFHRLKYICPDTFKGKNKAALLKAEVDEDGTTTKTAGGKREKFKGGLVFEPKRGLWDKYVLVMDFNSLYPSIIQEYNIDFTTLSVVTQTDAEGSDTIPEVPSTDVPQGVLPRIIAQLVNRRREVKNLMKAKNSSAILMNQWEIRQLALKLTANSMYGCLGFEYSRFYARPLAALTTFKGREILTSTKELAESVQLEVVYGDTDSVFVNSNVTDYNEAIKMANLFKKQVNDKYRLLEIDLDAVFQRLLLLQKKKYAAIKVANDGTSTQEVKGLDMKRREYCDLSKNVSKFVLDHILSGEATEVCILKVHDYLTEMGLKVRDGKIPLEDFIINKRLGKNPEDYPDAKSQPQVQVALRIKARGGSAKSGDVMQYIFCLGADGKAARTGQADRAYHPDEIRKQPELKIDYEYYLAQQILPPIERLCDPIEGTDKARLAECLGLDVERYAAKTGGDVEREFNTLGSQMSDKERFVDCDPFQVRCSSCDFVVERFGGLLDDPSSLIQPLGMTCSNCILLPKPQPTQEIMLPMRTARSSLLSRNLSHSSRPSLSLIGGALRASSSRASVPSSFSSPSSPFPIPSLLRNPISLRAYATAATPGSGGSKLNGLKMAMGGGQGAGEALKEFSVDLTQLARDGKMDPVIGREEEIRRTIQILSRRTKSNPVLLGPAGVGKTAILEGLAQRIINREVPESLFNKRVLSLDLSALLAGAGVRGMFEERFKALLKDIEEEKEGVICFIDEIHTLLNLGKSEGSMDAGNMIKPALARGLQLVGATTLDEYRKTIEKDPALSRRFQPVKVEEPTVVSTISILRGLKSKYEVHHGVGIADAALVTAAVYSQRYIPDRFLPDKAIDLVDEAASALRIAQESKPPELEALNREIVTLEIERESLKNETDTFSRERKEVVEAELVKKKASAKERDEIWVAEKQWLKNLKEVKEELEKAKIDLEIAQRENNFEAASRLRYDIIPSLQSRIPRDDGGGATGTGGGATSSAMRDRVTSEDIARVVARSTGIPVQNLLKGEKEKLIHMEDSLKTRVVGQDRCITAVSDAVRLSRAGLQNPQRPLASFLFLGPTGVGKTELSKALAGFLFDDEKNALITINMSEYHDRHTVSRLIGAAPGYVGYEEGGQLTEAVRRRPYAVINLDEVEKAHRDVSNILLQVLDEGKLTDSTGRLVDFRNTILCLTSNLGSEVMADPASTDSEGQVTPEAQALILQAVSRHFPPELVNRLDNLLIFNKLSHTAILKIVELRLSEIQKRLDDRRITLRVTSEATAWIAKEGWSEIYGARSVARLLQKEVLSKLARKLVEGKIRNGDTAAIDVSPDGKKLFIEDNHDADDDVPVYNPMRQYDEDVIDEGDEEDEFSLPPDQRRG